MSGKKKQLITICVLACCLLLLGGVYVLLPDSDSEDQEETEEESLYTIAEEDITGFRYSNEYADVSLLKEGDNWILSEDKDFPVDQEKIELMVTDMASMSFSRIVTEECEDLSEYQLNDPTLQIEITTKDGEVKNVIYGMKSDVAEGYYVSVDDKKKVYIVTNDTTMDFEYSVNQLMEVPELAEIETDYVTEYSLDKREGTDFSAKYAAEKAVSQESGWNIEKAYNQTVAGDADGLQNLFDNAYLLELTEGVCYNATEKQLKQYGFREPFAELEIQYFTIKEDTEESDDTEESGDTDSGIEDIPEEDREYHSFILYVGELNDMEDSYYVRVEGEKGIYLMPTDTVNSLVDFDIFDCVYKTPCPTYPEGLQSLEVEYQGKSYGYQQTKSGEDEDITYTVKMATGSKTKEIDAEKFHTTYSELGALAYSAVIKKGVKASSDKAVASITVKEEGRSYKAEFLPYDGESYRVRVDGVCQFLVDKKTANKVIKGLIQK